MNEANISILRTKVKEINKVLFEDPLLFPQRKISLLGGNTGLTLYLALQHQNQPDPELHSQVIRQVENSAEAIENSETLLATHCNGIAGWAWLLNFLRESDLTHGEFELYSKEVEGILESSVYDFLETKEFDLLHGAMGLGLVLLKSGRFDAVKEIIRLLDEDCEKSAQGCVWRRYDRFVLMEDIYDLGLAHGNAGILYFLTKCYLAGVMKKNCRELLEGGMKFFLNHKQDIDQYRSFFSSSIRLKEYETGDYRNFSRLGWCYGDLGILFTLLNSAIAIQDETCQEELTRLLIRVTERKDYKDTLVKDAGLCHGAAGIGYMYLKLFEVTGHVKFKEAFGYWLKETLDMGSREDGVAGYLFDMGASGKRPHYDVLTGLAGVGVFLMSAVNFYENKPNNWDSCLFLS